MMNKQKIARLPNTQKTAQRELADVTVYGEPHQYVLPDAPILDVFAERPNISRCDPEGREAVLVYVWCKWCERPHQHGMLTRDYRVQARSPHCTEHRRWGRHSGSYKETSYFIRRRKDGPIEYRRHRGKSVPVLTVVDRALRRGVFVVPCPFCLHAHHHRVGEPTTLAKSHCPKFKGKYFVRLPRVLL